jgi:hypothetical protein
MPESKNQPMSAQAFAELCGYCQRQLILPDDAVRVFAGLPPREPFLIPPTVFSGSEDVDRYLAILSALYKGRRRVFEEVAPTVRGTVRVYFAKSWREVAATGNSNQAQAIPNTPWYACTQNDSPQKSRIIFRFMLRMGFSREYADFVSDVCLVLPPRLPSSYASRLAK